MQQAYQKCELCPRLCGVDRTAGRRGVCRETADCRVASHGPHHGEEPCLSGTRGSGTFFFSGCACRCFFCQNFQISLAGTGQVVSAERLRDMLLALCRRGVHNLNFVTPDHFWPHIAEACRQLRAQGVALPLVWNSSGYHRPEMVAEYGQWMDIFLPDFKFADPDLAHMVMQDRRYPELALASLRVMVEQKGFLEPWDPSGQRTAQRGVLVRHLVLPGQSANSLRVLELLREEFGRFLPLSLMAQYHPTPACANRGAFSRPLRAEEYNDVCAHAEALGFENVFMQPEAGDADFFPDFHRPEPFRGNERKNT